ncbi:MAG TPA: alpha/beta fold hydrolase [Chryseosolibacter sp.]
MKEFLRIVTTDGFVLSATRFSPEKPTSKVILINSATGVKQRFYASLASYLANEGYTVYTYDYRGIGHSRSKSLRGLKASMKDWGTWDYHSMLQNIFQSHVNARVIVIGHSVGGQIVGLSSLTQKLEAVVMVGAQTPFIKNFGAGLYRIRLYFFWYFLLPVLTKIIGYFPAKKLGLFEDLPAGVAWQWLRWAQSSNFLFDEFPEEKKRFESLQVPALMINFTDDKIAPAPAVADLMAKYPKIKWSQWQLSPDDVMQKRIGHFGFFRKDMQQSLWTETAGWMAKLYNSKVRRAA